jgi:hypothetical protein
MLKLKILYGMPSFDELIVLAIFITIILGMFISYTNPEIANENNE